MQNHLTTLTTEISQPRLSIVIPTVNRAYCVGRAIESALAQTYPHIEIIVSDNGSSDATQEVIAGYNDPRLRKYHRKDTIPSAEHANFYLEQARGEFFTVLSDDDYLEPTFAEKVIATFDKDADVAFVYTGCWSHYGNARVPSLVGPEIEDGIDFIEHHYAGWRNVWWCACASRLSLMREIGHLPLTRNIGDMYYWTRLAFMGKVGCVHDHVSNYVFLTEDNATGGLPVNLWAAEEKQLMAEVAQRFAEHCSDLRRQKRLKKFMARYLSVTTSLQFVWVALRGATKLQLVSAFFKVWNLIQPKGGGLKYLLAAFLLPRAILKKVVISRARVTAYHNARTVARWQRHIL